MGPFRRESGTMLDNNCEEGMAHYVALIAPYGSGCRGALSPRPRRADDLALRVCRNEGQQQVIRRLASKMQRGHAGENLRRAILRVVVQERAAAGQFVLEIRKLAAASAAILVVLAANGESDAVSGRRYDRGWPDLDVEFDDFAVAKRLFGVVGM